MAPMESKQAELTRERLLQSASREIHRQGFQAASIANILEDTGLTKGALYHHFPTKQALGLAVIEEVIGQWLDGFIFRPLRESAAPVETLLDIIKAMEDGASADFIQLGCPLNNLMQEMSPLDQRFRGSLNGILNAWCAAVEGALRRGQGQGGVHPDLDCEAASLFIVSAWEGCIGTAKNLQSPEAFGSCMKQLRGYVEGLRVQEGAPAR